MMELVNNKVTAVHLKRAAYLYVRQSTLRQVVEHTESTKRQYALKQRAVQLGWRPEQVVVIDSDLGESGASTVDRDGFQKLVAEVSMGRAGIVLGLEVSRLARNSADWHRLLEICAFNDTLILDEDGIYNPGAFNDRLLLGLKGTMSEAELHVMRMRMIGGVLTKARRGELCPLLPIGFMYDEENKVVLDPDQQVQESIRLVFSLFRRTGSAYALVRHFRDKGLLFPSRPLFGPNRHELSGFRCNGARSCAYSIILAMQAPISSVEHADDGDTREAVPSVQSLFQKNSGMLDPGRTSWLYRLGDV